MASYTVSFGSRSAIFIEKEPGVLHRKSENDLFPAVLSLDQASIDYKVERLAHFIERTANESQSTFLRECRIRAIEHIRALDQIEAEICARLHCGFGPDSLDYVRRFVRDQIYTPEEILAVCKAGS